MIIVKTILIIIAFAIGVALIGILVFNDFWFYKKYWSEYPHVSLTFKEFRSFYELNPESYTLYDYHVKAYFDSKHQYNIVFDTKFFERNKYYDWKVLQDKNKMKEAINNNEKGYLLCVKKQIEEMEKNV